ncbi:MAG TPA: type II toxin-antitoxin system VapC family toxin [Pyrinomonadaceae bacterium]|nr:type II toxin-antitoxin system VapC family toxin [Pyrinomonadaceae bacterium]
MSNLSVIMRLLLDTNAFLYFINNDSALSEKARNLLESEVDLLISAASLWEIAIKFSIGKLSLPDSFGNFIPPQIRQNDIEILPITLPHLDKISSLPFHHKDPFDRLIVAQSMVENLPIVSSDAAFDLYGIERIW